MKNTAKQYLSGLPDDKTKNPLGTLFARVANQVATQPLRTAGLVIKAGGGVLAKTGAAAYYGTVKGRLVTVAAGVDMPALTGLVITAASFNVACFFIDQAGTVTARFGTEGTALGLVKFPDFPLDQALVGFLIITHSSTFTGGTTALDTATTVYVSPVGAFDPTFIF